MNDETVATVATATTAEIIVDDDVKKRQRLVASIDKLRAILQMEKELTASIERVQPYIISSYRTMKHATTNSKDDSQSISKIQQDVLQLLQEIDHPKHKSQLQQQIRIRPIPRSLQQAETILQIGRQYCNKTSAPPGWTTTTPLIHFSTPNPLPHQLRSSVLANIQLQQILKEKEKKGKEQQLLLQQQQQRKRKLKEEEKQRSSTTTASNSKTIPQQQQQQRKTSVILPPPKQATTSNQAVMNMNLSDDDDDDNDSDDSE